MSRSIATSITVLAMAAAPAFALEATTGPHGEPATPAASLTLTSEQEAKVKDGWNRSLHRDPPASLGAN